MCVCDTIIIVDGFFSFRLFYSILDETYTLFIKKSSFGLFFSGPRFRFDSRGSHVQWKQKKIQIQESKVSLLHQNRNSKKNEGKNRNNEPNKKRIQISFSIQSEFYFFLFYFLLQVSCIYFFSLTLYSHNSLLLTMLLLLLFSQGSWFFWIPFTCFWLHFMVLYSFFPWF